MRGQLVICAISCCLLLVSGSGTRGYISLGCWRDIGGPNRALPKLERTDPRLDGDHYKLRENAVEKCYQVALSRGFPVFALQNGGECFGSADGLNTYNKHGNSAACAADGEGGLWANEVYKIIGCPTADYVRFNGVCYKSFTAQKTQDEASEACVADGGMLAMPKDNETNVFLATLPEVIGNRWLGLTDDNGDGQWVYEDGQSLTSSDFSNWKLNDTERGAACVAFWENGTTWAPRGCNLLGGFICQLHEGTQGCRKPDYVLFDGVCYKAFVEETTRYDAQKTCAANGGILAMPKDRAINTFLANLPPAQTGRWLGLTDTNNDGQWEFEDGQILASSDYSNWHPGAPDNGKGCVGFLKAGDGSSWDERACLNNRGFICQMNEVVCLRIPADFQLDRRLTILPNPLGQETFNEIQNSPVVALLNTSYNIPGKHHPELREFVSTVIFPRCVVPQEEMSDCSLLCYHSTGMNYRGTWSTTTSGAKCLEWSTLQADYYTDMYPWANLDRNYCRNPTGLQRPFCLTGDGSQEECDVIPCNFVGCWDRGPPNYGKRTPSKRFYFLEEKVTYTCNDGYTIESGSPREATCLAGNDGGVWEYDKPVCSVNYKRRLQNDLLVADLYSASLAPENVIINFTGHVQQIIDLDEKKEQLLASVVITFSWYDRRLKWTQRHYNGTETLSVPGNNFWTPVLTLQRNANPLHQDLPKDVPVRVSSSGLVEWTVGTLTTTVCDADPFFFPADTMDCQICFSATSAIEQTIQCHRGSSPSDAHEESHPCDSFSPAKPDGEWYRRDKIFAKDKRVACFSVQLSRIPTFHIATTVAPCIILIVLMTITFIMPIDQGDRISFGVTIQLSMVVSLVFVTEVLPVKGALPFLATLIIVCMGLMGLFLFITIAVMYIHNKEGHLSPVARVVFLRYIARALLLGDLKEDKQTSSGTVEDPLPSRPAIEMTNTAFEDDEVTVVDDEASVAEIWLRKDGDPGMTGPPPKPPTGLESAGSADFLHLIAGVRELTKELKKGNEELTKAVKKGNEKLAKVTERMTNELADVKKEIKELTRAIKGEKVSDYTLLTKVLDRLCLVVYVISIVAAIPMTMYLSR
ncbi:uncharacterized protein LOC144877354 [Branchiostoma floridae x Branchiostoma japonicum]